MLDLYLALSVMDEKEAVSADSGEHYQKSLDAFTRAVEQCLATSTQTMGLNVSADVGSRISEGQRRYWASILFTRLCTSSISILLLCPESKINPYGAHWDLASVATLTRSLFESSLMFVYLAIENVPEDEWLTRLRVMQLHDCTSRVDMFRDLGWNAERLKGFEEQASELRNRISGNSFFSALPRSVQKKLLGGHQASMLTQDEIIKRTGKTSSFIWGYYKFLSSQVHPLPLGFYRMGGQNRGRGVENDVDRDHIAGALALAAEILSDCNRDMQKSFAGLVTFSPGRVDWSGLFKTK